MNMIATEINDTAESTPFSVNDSAGSFYKRVARGCGKKDLTNQEKDIAFKARVKAQSAFEFGYGGCFETDIVAKIAWGVTQKECWKEISQYGKAH